MPTRPQQRRQDSVSPAPEDRAAIVVKPDPDASGESVSTKKVRFDTTAEGEEPHAATSPSVFRVKEEPSEAVKEPPRRSKNKKRKADALTSARSRRQDTPEVGSAGEGHDSGTSPTSAERLRDVTQATGQPSTDASNAVKTEVKAEEDRLDFSQVGPLCSKKQRVNKLLTILFDHLQGSGETALSAKTLANQVEVSIKKLEKIVASCNRACYKHFVEIPWKAAKEPGGYPIVEIQT